MSLHTCYYHPEREAVATCTRCQRPICQDDIRYIMKWYEQEFFNPNNHPVYCFVCYASQSDVNLKVSTFGSLVITILIFVAIFGFVYITGISRNLNLSTINFFYTNPGSNIAASRSSSKSVLSPDFSFFALLFVVLIVLLIGILIHIRLQSHKEIDEAYTIKRKMEFQEKNIEKDYSYSKFKAAIKPLRSKKRELAQGTCYNCGAFLDKDDRYCPNCGQNNN